MATPRDRSEFLQQGLGEMQARRRRGDGAVVGGIDGLVVGLVALLERALGPDIGRQRHGAVRLDRLVELRAAEVERQRDLPRRRPLTVAASASSSATSAVSPSTTRSPAFSRLAGRAKARQVWASTRLCRLNETRGRIFAAMRECRADSAGITRVSLTTSTSPGAGFQ